MKRKIVIAYVKSFPKINISKWFLFSDDAEVLLSKNLDSAEKNLGQGSFCQVYIVCGSTCVNHSSFWRKWDRLQQHISMSFLTYTPRSVFRIKIWVFMLKPDSDLVETGSKTGSEWSDRFFLTKSRTKTLSKKALQWIKNFFSNLKKGCQAPGVTSSHPDSSSRHDSFFSPLLWTGSGFRISR
jgi:hypothetical protein